VDLEGTTVTEKIFEEADLTIINFWGTYCNPCIDEMDELGEWADEMPENVQLIGVAVDVSSSDAESCATAKQIVEETGAAYTQLVAGDAFDETIEGMVAVPTTFFVDREGNLVCEPVVGADVEAYKEAVEEYFNGNK
jgi:thiol-disulfide isomerase/thioredoxin